MRIETKIVSAGLREFAEGDKPVIFVDYQAKAVVLNPTRAKVLCSAYGLEFRKLDRPDGHHLPR